MPEDWKELHKRSLRRNQPQLYRELETSGELKAHLEAVDRVARATYKKTSERLRNSRREKWTPDQIERTATEIVMQEVILVMDAETLEAERRGAY